MTRVKDQIEGIVKEVRKAFGEYRFRRFVERIVDEDSNNHEIAREFKLPLFRVVLIRRNMPIVCAMVLEAARVADRRRSPGREEAVILPFIQTRKGA